MRTLSGELDHRIRYDVEHDLFHAQNVFNDEYIKPTFVEYVQKLEETNNELKGKLLLSDMVLADKTKRIKELENKLMDKVCLESLDIVSAKINDLEKENAELKKNCRKK